jgi:hypothetical protein
MRVDLANVLPTLVTLGLGVTMIWAFVQSV